MTRVGRILRILFFVMLQAVILCSLSFAGGSASESYAIPAYVISGGGGTVACSKSNLSSTLGQSSPLMDSKTPPYSTNYDHYPGFWHTLAAVIGECADIEFFASAYGSISGDINYNVACDQDY
ncbi:MAG: hypothetical protein DRG83_02570, partial [Deltaproteobacteria bacterium]